MASTRPGVLLTAFGGPDSLDAVGPFMARFMGREPSPALVESAREKYRAIGGSSPLPATAAAVASSLEHHLLDRGRDVPVRAGMRYWEPSIERAIGELAAEGVGRVVMVSLSAFESKVTCESYRVAAHRAAGDMEYLTVCEAPPLHRAPQYRDFFGHACAHALEHSGTRRPLVMMTAHSLPLADVAEDDPYVSGLAEVSDAVAAVAGLAPGRLFSDDERLPGVSAFGSLDGPVAWLQGYQSKGARPCAWLGPDLEGVMTRAAHSGYTGIVVVPVGFAIDHMETLWDLDVDAAERAVTLGLDFVRTPVLNDHDDFTEALLWAVEPLL